MHHGQLWQFLDGTQGILNRDHLQFPSTLSQAMLLVLHRGEMIEAKARIHRVSRGWRGVRAEAETVQTGEAADSAAQRACKVAPQSLFLLPLALHRPMIAGCTMSVTPTMRTSRALQ